MKELASGFLAVSLMAAMAILPTGKGLAQTTHLPNLARSSSATGVITPFQNNNGNLPPNYHGKLFTLNHAWPQKPLPPMMNAPWQKAIHGAKITPQNAAAYAAALKAYVTPNARTLILNYAHWDATRAHWYTEPWLGGVREAIHGTYQAGEFGPGIFPGTGLQTQFQTNVVTYYDQRAAYSLFKVWGTTAMMPNIVTSASQFEEGSVIVKAAVFSSENPQLQKNWWPVLKGAEEWPMYISVAAQSQNPQPPPQLWSGYVTQFDIIVKDSKSSPTTGWVFMTLVYDSSVPGDAWDKMVPLGVQWGNDPQASVSGQPLKENWNNPQAPLYSKQTLGFGGRLSGPNDGGRNNITVGSKLLVNEPDSGCISCHSTAQWSVSQHKMVTFLLPSIATSNPPGFELCDNNGKVDQKNGQNTCSPAPGSAAWMKWFQDRPGTQPMDAGSVAMDFDEVFSFKSLRYWWGAVGPKGQFLPLLKAPGQATRFNQYSGAPLRTASK